MHHKTTSFSDTARNFQNLIVSNFFKEASIGPISIFLQYYQETFIKSNHSSTVALLQLYSLPLRPRRWGNHRILPGCVISAIPLISNSTGSPRAGQSFCFLFKAVPAPAFCCFRPFQTPDALKQP
jgi:hypothetical protein